MTIATGTDKTYQKGTKLVMHESWWYYTGCIMNAVAHYKDMSKSLLAHLHQKAPESKQYLSWNMKLFLFNCESDRNMLMHGSLWENGALKPNTSSRCQSTNRGRMRKNISVFILCQESDCHLSTLLEIVSADRVVMQQHKDVCVRLAVKSSFIFPWEQVLFCFQTSWSNVWVWCLFLFSWIPANLVLEVTVNH